MPVTTTSKDVETKNISDGINSIDVNINSPAYLQIKLIVQAVIAGQI